MFSFYHTTNETVHMASKVLLISEKQLKETSIIENNVDSKVLSKVIQSVQEIQLKSILGTTLFNDLLSNVELSIVSGVTLSDSQSELLNDYIVPFMTYAVISDFLVINHYKVTNKGVLKLGDDNAESVSSTDLEYLKNYYDNYKSQFKKNLIDYLNKNSMVTETGKVDKDVTSTSIGWYLDK